jgi:hypothetical protein
MWQQHYHYLLNGKTMRYRALAQLLVLAATTPANAQMLTYDNSGEIHGAAVMALHAKPVMVEKVMSYCAKSAPDTSKKSGKAVEAWQQRNGAYLKLAPTLLEEMRLVAVRDGGSAAWTEFKDTVMPKQISIASGILVDTLETLPDQAQRVAMCNNIVASINAGRLDIASESPDVLVYLDRRLKDRGD